MSVNNPKEKILDTAEELFARNGFEATSVRELASKAGVNVAMISYYFGSKEKLFETLIEHRSSYLREKIHALNLENISSWQKMEFAIEYFTDRFIEKHYFHRILQREIGLHHNSKMIETISNIMMKNAAEMKRLINDGIKSKEFRKIDTEMMMASFIGTLWNVIGSYHLTCRVLGFKENKGNVPNEEIKKRLKKHLRDLFHSHLQPK